MDFVDLISPQQQPTATPKRETPMAEAETQIISGEYAFPEGKEINVIGPDGKSYAAPSNQLQDALKNGYRLEAPNETAKREFLKEYKGIKGDVIVGLGQFADEFLGGIPETAFDITGKKDDFDLKEALKADHEVANTIGGLSGFAASAFYGGPLAKLFTTGEKAGAEVASVVSKSLAKRGLSKNSAGLGAQIIAKTAENATKLGVEGLVASAPIAVTEASLGDPKAGAETLLMGGGLGVGLGILSGPTSVLFNKANKAAKETVLKQFPNETPNPKNMSDNTILGAAEAEGADQSIIDSLKKELSKKKDNVDDIIKAGTELDLPVLDEQLSASVTVQRYADALSKKATLPGFQKASQVQKIFDGYDKILKNVLGYGEEITSRFQTGEKAKISILKSADDAIKTEGAVFNELRQGYEEILLDEKPMQMVVNNIKREIIDKKLDDQIVSVAKSLVDKIQEGRISNLNNLFEYRTMLREMVNHNSTPGFKKTIGDLIEKLNYQEEETINRAIKRRIDAARVPGAATFEEVSRLEGLYAEMQSAKKRWHELASNLEDAGDALNLGTIRNPRDFVNKVNNLTAEQLANKLIPKADAAALMKLKEKFPQEFESVVNLEKSKILDKVTIDNRTSARKFVTEFKKMSPEMKAAIFDPDSLKKLDALKTHLESLPPNFNPSGTASQQSFMRMMSLDNLKDPSFYIESLSDFVGAKFLKKAINVDDIVNTEKQMVEVNKKLNKVPTILKNLSENKKMIERIGTVASLNATARVFGDSSQDRRESFDKIKNELEKVAISPEIVVDNITKNTEGFSASAPNITQEYISKTANSLNYLYQQLPKPMSVSTPFYQREWKPSDTDLAKFERKLSVVLDPFVLVDALADGSLTKDHVEAGLVNYPSFTSALKNRIFEEMSDKKHKMPYQTRLKMSLLMGYDIDGTTAPQNIAAFQNSFAMMPELQHNEQELNQSGLNKLKPADQNWTQSQKGLLET